MNWFVLPSEIGNMYAAAGQREARERGDRFLEPHPAHRVDHLGGQGPERVEPSVDGRGRGLRCDAGSPAQTPQAAYSIDSPLRRRYVYAQTMIVMPR